MPTDPTPLAQRLRHRALEALRTPAQIKDYEISLQAAADVAVVAVLRELADDFTNPDGEWIAIPPAVLLRLADSIEKGAE